MNTGKEEGTTNGLDTKIAHNRLVDKSRNQQLRTLLSIRRFSAGLQGHSDQLKQTESELNELSENSLSVLGANAKGVAKREWEAVLASINSAVCSINVLLKAANKKVEQKDRSDSSDLWMQIEEQIATLEDAAKEMDALGYEYLPEDEQKHWKNNVHNFQESILPLFISHAMAYKVELQMIEKYTPEELSKVTHTILSNIPASFTFEEAEKYEREYLKAMDDLEKELGQEKNLWDTFLDILAGGTHQTPAERVMLNRWVEGEKGDLAGDAT